MALFAIARFRNRFRNEFAKLFAFCLQQETNKRDARLKHETMN